MSSANIATATVGIPDPTVDEERVMEMTRENSVIQTIVALQQLTNTPTPGGLVNLPKPWTEIVTTTTTLTPQTTTLTPFPNSAVAAVINPNTPIKQGPGNNYKTACFVDERSQLKIIGRNNDSTWLRVTFSLGQTCYTLVNSVITEIIPDPRKIHPATDGSFENPYMAAAIEMPYMTDPFQSNLSPLDSTHSGFIFLKIRYRETKPIGTRKAKMLLHPKC